jgi:hypothetical protein
MTSEKEEETSSGTVKYFSFSGKKKDWHKWKITTLSLGKMRSCDAVHTDEDMTRGLVTSKQMTLGHKGDETQTPLTAGEKILFIKNAEAESCLLSSFHNGDASNEFTHTELGQCNNAYEMWQILVERFEPKKVLGLNGLVYYL